MSDTPGRRRRRRPSRRQTRAGSKTPGKQPTTPVTDLAPDDVDRGLRMLLLDGVSSQVMGSLTGGALLVAFALLLGASNKVVGLIAAVAPLSQLLQLPSVMLIARSRRRKPLVVAVSLVGRSFWIFIAAIPFIVPSQYRVAALVAALAMYSCSSNLASTAFNSWKRDLVPDSVMGRFFAKRLAVATTVGALVTLATGFAIDRADGWGEAGVLGIYSVFFLAGGLTGLLGVAFLGRIPEPRMDVLPGKSLRATFAEPLRDLNFRKLLIFLASWNFAVNLAAPFFTVYLLVRLEFPMAWVLGLSVVSQVANVLALRLWGRAADRVGNRPVLSLAGSLFILSIAIWPFTTMPERHALTIPLLVAIHLLAGVSTAGVSLSAANITLRLAPRGNAAPFLATNSLTSGIAATIAPILAGLLADRMISEHLSLQLEWLGATGAQRLIRVFDLRGLDFLFAIAVLCGLYSLHRLLAVEEKGRIDSDASELLSFELRRAVRNVSTAAGLRSLSQFSHILLRTRKVRDRGAEGASEPDPAGEDWEW